jgi:hypothetical protein
MSKLLVKLCCLFIFKKKNRRRFREKCKNRSWFEICFLSSDTIKKINTNTNRSDNTNHNEIIMHKLCTMEKQIKTQFEVIKLLIPNNEKTGTDITLVADICGTDKGRILTGAYHTYTSIYEVIFAEYREKAKNVFECGIGYNEKELSDENDDFIHYEHKVTKHDIEMCRSGGSLRLWRYFFPNAQIYGADIMKEVLFEEERIKTYLIDQTSPQAINDYFNNIGEKFDVMVEDGWHVFEAQNCMFENGVKYLKNDGIYVIEDVIPKDLLEHQRYFAKHPEFNVRYICMNSLERQADNNLIVIKYK